MQLLHDFQQSFLVKSSRRRLVLLAVAITTFIFISNRILHAPVSGPNSASSSSHDITSSHSNFPTPIYKPGIPKSHGQPYTRTLVIARTLNEPIEWLTNDYDLTHDPYLKFSIYTVDDPASSPGVPVNKGHEVMPYLTHIITNYANLTNVTLFMHAHRWTWHNNDLLNSDAKLTVQSLSSEKVVRDGYMNLRCHLDPGCPDHIHPSSPSADEVDQANRPEEAIVGRAWLELFPDEKEKGPPKVLSQPCCAQFALSADRIRAIPLERYIFFREWLLNSKLEDSLSGRVWEYVWQYLFAGVYEFCPEEHVCYCDGYGVCFGGKPEFEYWFSVREKWRKMVKERDGLGDGELESKEKITSQMDILQEEMDKLKASALERGKDPRNRATEVGRDWKDGDGF
jgi:Protein of unknown function (DUF3431)